MRKISYALLAAIIAGCAKTERATQAQRDSTAVVDTTRSVASAIGATAPTGEEEVPLNADEVRKEVSDSADDEWSFAPRRDYESNSIYSGRMKRRPSGVLRIWFDTATRATEEKPMGNVAIDSITVTGLQKGEIFTSICNRASNRDTQIVGVVKGRSGFDMPRLVWQLDTATKRIKELKAAGIFCSAQNFDEVDD